MRVAIIDYGSGNLRSATKAFERAAREAGIAATIELTAEAERVRTADRIVLPGVGAYADCRAGLDAVPGMTEAVEEAARRRGRPFLGICVGMQLMSERGLEKTVTRGFGWIKGDVREIEPGDPALKVPQIGWNTLAVRRDHPLFAGIPTGPDGLHAYFVHSYHLGGAAFRGHPRRDRLWRHGHRGGGARQPRRHPVPPREEPGAGPGADLQLPALDAMILFPAIDLKDGQCVRLKLGDMARATVYNADPAAQAAAFEAQGFEWLHVVDLDGAFAGKSVNGAAVDAILAATSNPVQLGGGIRSIEQIEAWLDKGLARVILGTAAVKDPALVEAACRRFPGRIAVGIDARGGQVAVEGWAEASSLAAAELSRRFEGAGVAALIYTDIDRDGVLAGINWEATIALADAVEIPVIASGGLASLADVVRLTMPDAARLEGAISGRALYDGRIDPAEALAILRGEAPPVPGLFEEEGR